MKCLMKYQWIKLPRNRLPEGKGIMGAWARLASRVAFCKGKAHYCGYENQQEAGLWVGGIVGLKRILGVRTEDTALGILKRLSQYGYVEFEFDEKTKKIEYRIVDWVRNCSGAGCTDKSSYTSNGYGFLCVPRSITQRLVEQNYQFEEADAWLDLWCHTVSEDLNNAFSFLSPAVQLGRDESVLTLEKLGKRWGWEKTKVWRFFRKYQETFHLIGLPGSYGCIVFNIQYLQTKGRSVPCREKIVRILDEIRIFGTNTHKRGSDHEHINRLVRLFSHKIMQNDDGISEESLKSCCMEGAKKSQRVNSMDIHFTNLQCVCNASRIWDIIRGSCGWKKCICWFKARKKSVREFLHRNKKKRTTGQIRADGACENNHQIYDGRRIRCGTKVALHFFSIYTRVFSLEL